MSEPTAARYSPEQLRLMARRAIAARGAGDDRFLQLVLALSVRLGMRRLEVSARIEEMAA